MKHLKSFNESSLSSDIEFIFSEIIDEVDVSDFSYSYRVNGLVYDYEAYKNDSTIKIEDADRIYIQFLLNAHDNKELYQTTLRPLAIKAIKKAKHLGFDYEELKYEASSIFYYNDGITKTVGDTLYISLNRININ